MPTSLKLGRRQAILLGSAGIIALAGCAPTKKTKLIGGVVLDLGGPDDHSFNASAVKGLSMAQSQLHLPVGATKWVETNSPSDYQTNLAGLAAQGYEVVFAVGYAMYSALKEVAPQFPKIDFAIVDDEAPSFPNCAGIVFKENESSFLAGYLAGEMTKTGKIGFVGGQQIPLIEKFEAGYRAGAETANPKVVVTATYTGDWNDETKGRSQAAQQFGAGDDIIFQAAGKAGLGVINEAKARGAGYYAIGVDMDQAYLAPGRVLTSVIKRIDVVIVDTIKDVIAGKFQSGTHIYGLKDNGVGLSPMTYTKQLIPPQVLSNISKLQNMIIDGKFEPPSTLAALKTFTPPKL